MGGGPGQGLCTPRGGGAPFRSGAVSLHTAGRRCTAALRPLSLGRPARRTPAPLRPAKGRSAFASRRNTIAIRAPCPRSSCSGTATASSSSASSRCAPTAPPPPTPPWRGCVSSPPTPTTRAASAPPAPCTSAGWRGRSTAPALRPGPMSCPAQRRSSASGSVCRIRLTRALTWVWSVMTKPFSSSSFSTAWLCAKYSSRAASCSATVAPGEVT